MNKLLPVLSKKEAVAKFMGLREETIFSFEADKKYSELRSDFLEIDKKVTAELSNQNKDSKVSAYDYDLLFAKYMYQLLSEKYFFSERQASQDGTWMFLSIEVVPDIVYKRWTGLNESRFFKESRRIWLKALWWYWHLSWQGDYNTTYEILKYNTTDDLVQLIERSGSKGYRIELYREIMKIYSQITITEKGRKNQLFRKVMKLNTARSRVVEPALTVGGEKQYVKELFKYFDRDTAKET